MLLTVRGFSYQEAFELLGLRDVNPVVFLNNFNVLHFIIKPVKRREMFLSLMKLFPGIRQCIYELMTGKIQKDRLNVLLLTLT